MANGIEQLKKLELPKLQQLAEAKKGHASATTDEDRQRFSAIGDEIRAGAGIEAGSAGLGTLQDVQSIIDTRRLEVPKVEQPTERMSLQDRIAQKAKEAKIGAFKQQLEAGMGALQAEEESLTPKFLEARRGVETQATMRETAAQKAAQTGGLGQAGSLPQTQIASDVIKQGAVTGLTELEQEQRADINRRRTQLQSDIAAGIAGAETEAELATLNAQLEEYDMRQAQAVKDAEIRSEREFTLMRDQMAQMNKESLARLDNSLKQENMVLDAQIQEARDNLQFERAQELERQRSQNNIKLQAIRQTDALALEDRRDELTEDERRLLDLEIESAEATVKEAELRNKKLERDLEEIASDPVVETIPSDILNTLNATFIKPITDEFGSKVGEEVDNDKMWNAVVELYLNGNLTAQQADRLEAMYGLTEPPSYVYQGGR